MIPLKTGGGGFAGEEKSKSLHMESLKGIRQRTRTKRGTHIGRPRGMSLEEAADLDASSVPGTLEK